MSKTTPENVIPLRPARPRRNRRPARPTVPAGTPLPALLDSWILALRAANKAKNTILSYTRSARAFIAYLTEHGMPDDGEGVEAEHVRAFLVSEQERTSVHTSAAHHRNLSVWFRWMIDEEERSTLSPVLRADAPKVPKKVRRYLSDEELSALLAACKGPGFLDRRDTAVLRILIDNGMRLDGVTGLMLDDVDLRGRRLRITLKGGDQHWAPIGAKAVQALDRYLRVRARHTLAGLPNLWLGSRGKALTRWGVTELLEKRGNQAGIEKVGPHMFRGTAAHDLLAAGAHPNDVQSILGWKSAAMVRHYTEDLAHERARETHARLSPSDRL
ncbi:tyrosine-type recombinase/integrase [Streptosporangium sp. NPDC051022]|uniref:tyrosine-type recombinase/integrase n=1 Tax=Streptosporangium sp. NPDC051022 TaxID=3155752 RepID=UPI00341E015F